MIRHAVRLSLLVLADLLMIDEDRSTRIIEKLLPNEEQKSENTD